jgi:hypothetical protein
MKKQSTYSVIQEIEFKLWLITFFGDNFNIDLDYQLEEE